MALLPGSRLGPYEIVAPLGAGGMGEVYRAKDLRLGRDVALKVLPVDVASRADRLARFEREARTVAALSHPNIVVLYSVEDDGDVRFLTMELVEGQSLDQHLVPGGMPLARVLDLGIALSDALAAAHERGVVHRDLKPGNVMLTREGRVKVLDFGLAKLAAADAGLDATHGATMTAPLSRAGQVMGTVPYMAPEQIRGETVDARADLFALGILLYELATGHRPFTGATLADVSSAILRDTPEALTRRRADLPGELERIVARCLEKDPLDRFQTALDMHSDLRALRRTLERGSEPLEPAPSSGPVRPSIAALRFANLGGDPEQQYFADGMVEDVLTGLSRIKGLSVIARNSSFAFSSATGDIRKTARELGARYILEGSVRKSGDRVRVTAQLIEAESARYVWSDRYDRKLDEIFALQDDLAMSVVAAIEPNLRAAEIERVTRKRPDDLDAYDLLLRALPLIYPAMPDGAAQGLPLIEKAIAKEPDYAQAHAFAAWGHEIMFMRGGYGEDNRRAAIRHAQAALAHGRDDAIALALGGFVMGVVAHDRVVARQAFDAALELSPSCALAYNFGSVVYAADGDAGRAIEWGEEAIRLSPRDPVIHGPLCAITLGHIARGDDEAAFAAAQKTMHAQPTWTTSHVLMAATQARLGRGDGARSSATRVIELQPDFTISGFCATVGLAPSVAAPLSEGLRLAGLDE